MTADQRYSSRSAVVARQVADETVLLDLESGTYYGLDLVGTRVWQLLQDGRSVGEVCDVLVEEYEVERTELEADIDALIADLIEKKLVIAC